MSIAARARARTNAQAARNREAHEILLCLHNGVVPSDMMDELDFVGADEPEGVWLVSGALTPGALQRWIETA